VTLFFVLKIAIQQTSKISNSQNTQQKKVNKYFLECYRDKLQRWYDNPTQIHLIKFIKMTLNRFCAEPTVKYSLEKNESRLIGKVLKNSTAFV
jgi:hypothetical protein